MIGYLQFSLQFWINKMLLAYNIENILLHPWWRHQMETFPASLALCDQWIPLAKASDMELWCILWSASEQMVEQTIEMPVIWEAIMLIMTSL